MKKEDKLNKIDTENSLKLIAKTSLIVFIGVFLSKILAYIYRIIIARYYGPEVYGLFSLVTIILGIIVSVSSLGLSDGLLRFIPQYRGSKETDKVSHIFKFTLKVLFISSIISAIILFLASEIIAINIFHNPELTNLIKILSLFIPIVVISNPFLIALRSYEKISTYSFIYNVLQNIIRVLSLLILIAIGFKSSSTVISYCLGFLTVLICSYLVCKYKISELFLKSNLSSKDKILIRKEFFSYSLPLLFFGIVSMIFYWVDSFFLGYLKGAESVGFYNAAVPIATILLIMPELFMQLFFPMINRHYSNKNFELIKQLSKQIGKWIFMVNFPVFILIFVFPGAAINILFGNNYLVAENSLRIIILGSFIASIATISNNLLSMAGKSKLVLADIIIACGLNIILNLLLIPAPKIFFMDNSLGINGAAIATAISMIFLNILFLFQAKKYLGILPLRMKMIKIFVIGIISGSILMYLRSVFTSSNLFLIAFFAICFLGVYTLLILISRSLDENDLTIFYAIKRKFLS